MIRNAKTEVTNLRQLFFTGSVLRAQMMHVVKRGIVISG